MYSGARVLLCLLAACLLLAPQVLLGQTQRLLPLLLLLAAQMATSGLTSQMPMGPGPWASCKCVLNVCNMCAECVLNVC